ncbi:MAG: Asp-tRNA(Asn)/Glu-tRNA(Gln) amidotransferase subunit GatC [Proteobacteria bacterium]|nr:Asp-tRNA(Asn)/Glu-tRNA(Gln) amidotransferase subunit GatC [Pseudomonadota bacterium]
MPKKKTHIVTEAEVLSISKLASIELSPREVQSFSHELSKMLGFLDQLAEVDTSSVNGDVDTTIRLQPRPDVVADGGHRDDVLANAPAARHGYFVVPKVIE